MEFFGLSSQDKKIENDDIIFELREECIVIPDHKHKSGKRVVCGLVFANWCGHCIALKPQWKKMVKNIHKGVKHNRYHEPVFIPFEHGKIEKLQEFNSKNAKYLDGKAVTYDGFPTLFKINNGAIEYYKGTREPAPMEQWFMRDNLRKNKENHTRKYKPNRKTAKNRTRTVYK